MSITLSGLIIGVGIAALILTLVVGLLFKDGHKSWLMTYLQNFTGALFIFSGFVKAIDPLGTAYKMEQYFTEFSYTFEPTWFGFLSPVFEWFNNYSVVFSVVMIVFEIVLGIMLILGMKSKLTGWLFFGLVAFFTFLTGFTYLTGYVPDGGNFFSPSSWGAYNANNMKVTDCGCFGDFLKLEPKVSFFKDVALLFPAVYFLFKHEDMHQLFSEKVRNWVVGLSTVGLIVYCFSNFSWDLPHTDFRPFSIGTDVAAIRQAEEDAAANVQVVAWKLKNNKDGKIVELPTDQYFAAFKTYSKANGWEVLEQISTEPAIEATKISEFDVADYDGNDVTYEYLEGEGNNFMIVSHKMYGKPKTKTITVIDSLFTTDTVAIFNTETKEESLAVTRVFDKVVSKEKEIVDYIWDEGWKEDYISKIKPLAESAKKDGHKLSIILGGADQVMSDDFKGETGIDADYYTADDILLKTIVRSNPGVVLWNDGKIIHKWHKSKLPSYGDIKSSYIK